MTARLHSARWQVGVALLLALALGAWQSAVAPATALGAPAASISYVSAATYTADPAHSKVHVAVRVTATVHSQDTAVTRNWFEGLQIAVPASTAGYQAASGQTALSVGVVSRDSSDALLAVGFGRRVYNAQSFSFVLQFDLVDTGKAPSRDLRLSKTLVSFPVWAYGSAATPGSTVSVVFPAGYIVYQEVGALTSQPSTGGSVTYSTGALADVTQFYAWFSAETTPSYVESTTKVGPLSVTLRHWADDPNWAPAISGLLTKAYPVLRELIGIGDVPATTLTIIESPVHDAGGYSGLFEPDSGTMAVSYSADSFVLLHELCHLWFNGGLVGSRWEAEGFASYYADLAAQQLKVPALGPELTSSLLAAAIPLDTWSPIGTPTAAQDQYAYAASSLAARQIAAIAGSDGLAAAWKAAKSGEAAYQPPNAPSPVQRTGGPPDSRSLLDLLEQQTGKSFGDVWRQWVVGPGEAALLDRRQSARDSYETLIDESAGWRLPDELRRDLETWDFGPFGVAATQARAVFADRTTIVAGAARELTTVPGTLRVTFERDGVGAALVEANAELQALDALAAARAAGEGTSGTTTGAVGLFGANPQRTLEEARAAFARGEMSETIHLADEARAIWEGATDAGRNRLLLAGGAALGIALLTVLAVVTRHRRRRHGDTADRGVTATGAAGGTVAGEGTAPDAIAAVTGDGFVDSIGGAIAAPPGRGGNGSSGDLVTLAKGKAGGRREVASGDGTGAPRSEPAAGAGSASGGPAGSGAFGAEASAGTATEADGGGSPEAGR